MGETASLGQLRQDPRNARKHNPRNVGQIESSIQRDGFGRPVFTANDLTIIGGNATVDAAASAGLEDVIIIDSDGTKVIAIRRTDIEPDSPEFHRLALADNRAAELAEWDADVLASLAEEVDLSAFWQEGELDALLASFGEPPTLNDLATRYGAPEDAAFWPEVRVKVPPETMERYESLMRLALGATDAERFAVLLGAVDATAFDHERA